MYYLREQKNCGHYLVELEDHENLNMSVSTDIGYAKRFDTRNSVEEFRADNRERVGHMEIVRDNTKLKSQVRRKDKVTVSEKELSYAETILSEGSFHSLLDDIESELRISKFIESFKRNADIQKIIDGMI